MHSFSFQRHQWRGAASDGAITTDMLMAQHHAALLAPHHHIHHCSFHAFLGGVLHVDIFFSTLVLIILNRSSQIKSRDLNGSMFCLQ